MFDTLYPEHAIERCTVTLSFDAPVPPKVREKALGLLRAKLLPSGFVEGRPMGLRIGGLSGQLKVDFDDAPAKFDLPSGGIEIVLLPDSIFYNTGKYVRWRPFLGQFQDNVTDYLNVLLEVLSVKSVGLEYLDRFIWSGDWQDIDYSLLLKSNSNLVSQVYQMAAKQWHSHIGAFEFLRDFERRLLQVNVDVTDLVYPNETRPAVGILTLLQDEFTGTVSADNRFKDVKGCIDALEDLHKASKGWFAKVVVPEVANRINLNSEDQT